MAGVEAADRGIAAAGPDPALVRLRTRLTEVRAQETARRTGPADDEVLGPPPAPPRRLRPDAQTDLGTLGAWTREHWPGRLAQVRQTVEEQLREKKWGEAQRTIETARATSPDAVFEAYLRGIRELALGNADEAEKRFVEALAAAPRFPTVIAALARAWAQKSGAFGAGEQLMQLAQHDPGLALARYMAARAYVESRDPIKAEEALRRGLALQPDSPGPYQHLADYYFGLDRAAEAMEIGQQGLDRFPQALDLRLMLAQITASLGRNPDAIRYYEEVVARWPDLDLARYRLATLLASQEDDAPRRRFLQVVRELQNDRPSDPLLLDALGWMLYRAQDTRRARELLEVAVKGAPDEPSLHFHLATVYAQEKMRDRAREELKAALDSGRPFAERLDALRLLRENRL
jgi:tetratricopeptide (TPR) repeat protein